MRGDNKLDRSIRGAQAWEASRFDAEVEEAAGSELMQTIGQSFSGKERNKLFFSRRAEQFVDLSVVSGLDNVADSRVLALWDFDRDGWQDMAVVNANAPFLNIYRNEIGAAKNTDDNSHFIAVRFEGGSRSSRPQKQFGCRDGYGARVHVTTGDVRFVREHRCGEGMAGQNSRTMIVGIGASNVADKVEIRWLSGIRQEVHDVAAGTLLTVYEDGASGPDGAAEMREPYVIPAETQWDNGAGRFAKASGVLPYKTLHGDVSAGQISPAGLRLYTTMATWCAACTLHLPQVSQLRSELDSSSLELYGVPVDISDDVGKLTAYEERNQPAYTLLKDMADEHRQLVQQKITDVLHTDALPSSVVTDAEGRILLITAGLPTLSQLRKVSQGR